MSQRNVEVVRDQFAAVNERDFPRAMSHYAEDVELIVDREGFLEGGRFNGREAVGQWFADWFETFEPGYRFEIRGGAGSGRSRLSQRGPSRPRANQRGRGARANGIPVRPTRRQDRPGRAVPQPGQVPSKPPRGGYAEGMCRNIRTLHNFEPPATAEEVHDAALQYVRKISGSTKPSQANAEAFERAVERIAAATADLLDELVTSAPPKDREVEAAKRRARASARYATA